MESNRVLLTSCKALDLAKGVCPVFRFHPSERAYPTSPELYLAGCDVYRGSAVLPSPSGQWTVEQLLRADADVDAGAESLTLRPRAERIALGTQANLVHAPVFALVRLGGDGRSFCHVQITFVLFFEVRSRVGFSLSCTRGDDDDGSTSESVAHGAEFQRVTVDLVARPDAKVTDQSTDLGDPTDYDVHALFLSAGRGHPDGFWTSDYMTRAVACDQLGSAATNPTRTLVYVAAGSHGLQARDGTQFRSMFCDNDYTSDDGVEWVPTPAHIQLVRKNEASYTPAWLNYRGSWSERCGEVRSGPQEAWWKRETEQSSNFLTCVFLALFGWW